MRNSLCLLMVFATPGCVGAVDSNEAPAGELAQAIGEPNGDFPSPDERLGIMAINRARSDPATLKGAQSAMYPARPPVLWSYDLSRSSRFHSTNLELAKVTLMHTSPCPLNTNVSSANCDGDPACACATPVPKACQACANVAAINTCGTDPFVRIGYFTANTGVSATGEVAAAGYSDPLAVVDGWVDEPAGSDGHRKNLLDVGITSNVMGYGRTDGANCWSSFDVSDSGEQNVTVPKIFTAAVAPTSGGAGSRTFYAAWADPTHGAPTSLNVVVDGTCTPMTRELGTDTLNATYKLVTTLAAGCHSYWILGKDGGGGRNTFPTTGAITISVGGVACNGAYLAQAPAASCEGAPPPSPDMSMMMMMPHPGDASMKMNPPPGSKDMTGIPGSVGDPCQTDTDCQSHLCALEGATGFCTQVCDPAQANACPAEFTCGTIGSDHVCLPIAHTSGGCSVAARPGSTRLPSLLALVLLALLFRRRLRFV